MVSSEIWELPWRKLARSVTRKPRNLLRQKFTHGLLEVSVTPTSVSPVVASSSPVMTSVMIAQVSVPVLESDFVLSIVWIVSRCCGSIAYTGS